MIRLLRRALLLLALCAAACEGTETGNPDPSSPHMDAGVQPPDDGGATHGRDAGTGADANMPPPPQDAGSSADAGAFEDGGRVDEDGGDEDEDAGR